ncbi:MAG: hypothetical protein KJ941_09170, partial [Bacteroidetes bacterium]|nr:hypothetical protein [Bacteroidota bacterium]
FYLDYLEGNLSKEDSIALELFLNAHPELKVDDYLPTFQSEDAELTFSDRAFLQDLSRVDFITEKNIEAFLIADLEGQLDFLKKRDLEDFLAKNPSFQQENFLYQQTILDQPTHLLYPNKSELKRKSTITLWPTLTIAAASICGVLLFQFFENSSNPLQQGAKTSQYSHHKTVFVSKENTKDYIQLAATSINNFQNNKEKQSTRDKIINLKLNTLPLSPMADKSVIENTEITPLSKVLPVSSPTSHNNDYTIAMKNQIAPVTRVISDVIKQEVVYQKGIDEKNKRQRFFIKIGKLEISTNRSLDAIEN